MFQMKWFKHTFGFTESKDFEKNRSHFSVSADGYLECPTSEWPRQYLGEFETPSLSELRAKVKQLECSTTQVHVCGSDGPRDATASAASPLGGGLTFSHRVDTDVGALIRDPSSADAVFQVASQFK